MGAALATTGRANPVAFDRRRILEARAIKIERRVWNPGTQGFHTASSARAGQGWLARVWDVVLRDDNLLSDSTCVVACGRCLDQVSVDVSFDLVHGLLLTHGLLVLHMREGLAFLHVWEGPSFGSLRAWRFAESSEVVAGLLREVKGVKPLEAGWRRPLAEPEPLSPDSAAYRDDDLLVTGLPEAVEKVAPDYPPQARDAGVERVVNVGTLVAADGSVVAARVAEPRHGILETAVQSAGQRALSEAAVDAVRRWRFKPATCGSTPVAVWVVVPVRFKLQ